MSDFVTELRREVVTAHAQHHVAAVRTRRRRRRPILAGAVALAALLVAVVWALRSIPPPERTAEPRVVKVLRIGGDPIDGTFAAGSLWVADVRRHRVVRIDPERRRVVGEVALDDGPDEIAGDDRAVWARAEGVDRAVTLSRLWRIDPGSGRVTAARTTEGYCNALAVTGGTAWMTNTEGSVGDTIDRLSAAAMPSRRIPFAGGSGLAPGGRWLWVVSKEGTVARINARTARIAHRWTRLAPSGNGDASEAIVADPRGAWLLSAGQGRILRLGGDRVTRVLRIDDNVRPILANSGGGLWIVTSDDPTSSRIARVDPRTGAVTATVELGKHYPRALVPARGGLWVIAGDGTAVLVDT